jgi:hypothetical protein
MEVTAMKIGDASRPRRFAGSARQRWYAFHRAVRFAERMGFGLARNRKFHAGPENSEEVKR